MKKASNLVKTPANRAQTGGPVGSGYSEFLPEDPLPKLLPDLLPKSPAGGASVLTLLFMLKTGYESNL